MSNFILPSGARIDLDRPDFAMCRDAGDLMELKYALSEKIIDIELQIDLLAAGAFAANGDGKAIDWLPRAKAAARWAKLYRDEAQNRQGRIAGIERQQRHAAADRAVLDIVKALLPAAKFRALMEAGEALAAQQAEALNGEGPKATVAASAEASI